MSCMTACRFLLLKSEENRKVYHSPNTFGVNYLREHLWQPCYFCQSWVSCNVRPVHDCKIIQVQLPPSCCSCCAAESAHCMPEAIHTRCLVRLDTSQLTSLLLYVLLHAHSPGGKLGANQNPQPACQVCPDQSKGSSRPGAISRLECGGCNPG